MSEPTPKLPQRAEDLLRDFPMAEPDFEAQARAIEARLKSDAKDPGALLPPSAGVLLEDLIKAPALAAETGEPGPASQVRAAEPPKSSFAEMARRSVQKNQDDAAQLARELLAATAQSRRPSAEMVERVRAAGRTNPNATATPLPYSEAGAEDVQRTSGVIARAEPPKAGRAESSNRGMVLGLVGGALALAACVALFVRSGESETPTEAALAAEKASAPAVPIPAKPSAPGKAPADEGVLSPEALAAAPEPVARELPKGAASKPAGAGPSVAAASSKAAASSTSAKPEAVVLEDDPEPSKAAPIAEVKAEPAPEPKLKPAHGNNESVPLTPSSGAVSTALGSVRGNAQACLAGQTEPVTATVTFAADGHVSNVRAGGPSAACIQAALSKARIAPFAKDSFSATTTIRPP